MGFSLRRWLLATLSRRETAVSQADWKHLRFSYAQFGEDLIAGHLLPEPNGFYVDAGAFHPVRLSNTYAFYRRGWRGIVVDANPDTIARFRRRRPRDIAVQAALAEFEADAEFEIDASGETSALRGAGAPVEGRRVVRTLKLRTRTLASVLDEYLPAGRVPDFLSIDCERADLGILRSNDWARHRPRVIAAEDWEGPAQSPIHALLTALGYELVAAVSIARIYRTTDAPAPPR